MVNRAYDRGRFDHLLVGCPHELLNDFRAELRTDVAELLAGRLSVDVGTAGEDDVLEAMRPALEQHDERLERAALERLGGPQSAAGVPDVLTALNERRVEILLLAEGWSEPGVVCPACGWVGPAGSDACPADGTATDAVDDLTEQAVQLGLQQDARVLVIRRRAEQLRALGQPGALLRF